MTYPDCGIGYDSESLRRSRMPPIKPVNQEICTGTRKDMFMFVDASTSSPPSPVLEPTAALGLTPSVVSHVRAVLLSDYRQTRNPQSLLYARGFDAFLQESFRADASAPSLEVPPPLEGATPSPSSAPSTSTKDL